MDPRIIEDALNELLLFVTLVGLGLFGWTAVKIADWLDW